VPHFATEESLIHVAIKAETLFHLGPIAVTNSMVGSLIVLVLLGSLVGWVLVPVIPALAWSRLQLARHQPVELIAGTALGVITGLAVHFV
jgi:membrane-associated phospholipid phosphatase